MVVLLVVLVYSVCIGNLYDEQKYNNLE